MLTITLRIKGEERKFSQDFISGYLFRKALELDSKRSKYLKKVLENSEAGEDESDLHEEQDKLLSHLFNFICIVFDQEFTPEEYEAGTDARKLMDQSWMIVHGIINQVTEPLEDEGEDDKKKTQ
ncbi:phage tail assembly chaperone G [Marininema halotolerans]|uniref:Uncharacterized protein n=1 Tax=Marininema halotolerans TaxID=1155944 RepID=A0A1I6URX8_9BACL|nr:hypothetical protein [Marininema halotolerans]SFT04074.1 hypothetical protein SAMN05444972_11935 [Marininema halotolerans]